MRPLVGLLFVVHILAGFSTNHAAPEDFYDLLGLDRSATTKDIRKAFKKAALKMHPDKNLDDPDADSKFIRINRAYEVLKDDEMRKKYDQFGEEGLENSQSGRGYHSWSYYKDNFGIYDDDPEIITLSKTDFDSSVTNSHTPWFINYYHPMCSHCHLLAPDWRWLSIELLGVVRIGAVNCDDEFHLCSEQGIHSYPTLLAYPGPDKFLMEKNRENLVSFILGRLPTGHGIPITTGMLHNMRQLHRQLQKLKKGAEDGIDAAGPEPTASSSRPWLLAALYSQGELDDYKMTLIKLAAIFSGVVNVGRVECSLDPAACISLNFTAGDSGPVLRFYPDKPVLGGGVPVMSETTQGVAQEVLAQLPELPLIDEHQYKTLHEAMEQRKAPHAGWLVQFASDNDTPDDEYRKVAGLATPIPCHRVLCSTLSTRDCDALYISKTPAFVLFKPGGGYEIHHGRLQAQDIANFAREAAGAPHFRTLTPKEFPSVLSQGRHWFVDFYAPWCPPCMRLLPQFRRAAVLMQQHLPSTAINFGIIDCTTHGGLCSQFNVHSYPTTILYNNTTPHQYRGHHSSHHIVEFVKDTLNPTVVVLTPATFQSLVLSRSKEELFVVDFFASWCGPCQAMAPEYRRFSRLVSATPNVLVGSVDCAEHRELCSSQGVRSYPTIRLYRANARPEDFSTYNEYARDAESFKRWLYTQLPSKVTLLNDRSFEGMLRSPDPWLVDFFAPWCGHCHQFAPDFEDLARSLEGSVKLGKLDCQAYQWVCRGAGINAYPSVMFYKGATLLPGSGKHHHQTVHPNHKQDGSGDFSRQDQKGELLDSLQPQAILSHVRWRLQQLNQRREGVSGRARDEL